MTKTVKEKLFFIVTAITLVVTVFLSLRYGYYKLTFKEFLEAFTNSNSSASNIVLDLRLPRTLSGIFAGLGLAVSGAIVQAVTDNDMASPSIVGINSGAGFFVAFFMIIETPFLFGALPLYAFVGALAGALFITATSRTMGFSKTSLILTGLAINAVFTAGISFFRLLDEGVSVSYHYFSVGTLAETWFEQYYIICVPLITIAFMLSWIYAGKINLLRLGDGLAGSLGANVKKIKWLSVVLVAILSGAVVSFAGLLGFVGLIAPHVAKIFVGGNLKKLIPASALTGALLVTLSDFLGRIIFAPTEVPVGIIMAIIGAPFFLYLLIRGKNNVRT